MFRPMYRALVRRALILASALLIPTVLNAQSLARDARASTHVSVVPYVGLYTPIGLLRSDSIAHFRQLMTLVLGARVNAPITRRLALEAAASWTPVSNWVAQSDWQQTVDVPGKATFLSAVARYVVNPNAGPTDWILSLASGVGSIHRRGRAWEGFTGTTDVAGVLGVSTRLRALGSRFSYGMDVQSYFTRVSYLDYAGQRTPERFHADIISSFVLHVSI